VEAASGTKELIFDTFVEMTSDSGFENVSMRDIARKVGINPASIYYHFENKNQLLEYSYEYFILHQYENRISREAMRKLIESASPREIVRAYLYTKESEDQKKYIRMVLITKIVFMRFFQDPLANAIFIEMNANNAEYVFDTMNYGVRIGRIDPDFDIETFSAIFFGAASMMGFLSFASPEYVVQQLAQEERILDQMALLLTNGMRG